MCNCKGWDIAYYSDEVTVEPHFCRLIDDCGSRDNTLEEAADEVASVYAERAAWEGEDNTPEKEHALEQAVMWLNRTHPSYLFYKEQES